jgi:hypothetical protein
MRQIKNVVRNVNDIACGKESLFGNVCGGSTRFSSNYVLLIGVALLVQYVIPVVIAFLIIVFLLGNAAALSATMILALVNPYFLIALIPIISVDAVLVGAFVIGSIIMVIIYWAFYFQKIGVLVLIPVGAWLAGFLVSFLPGIGGILSGLMTFFPWMAFASVTHWWSYRE